MQTSTALRRFLAKSNLGVFASYLILSSVLVAAPQFAPIASAVAPTCDGQTATIYVSGGLIVGGPQNGQTFVSTILGTSGDDVIVGGNGATTIHGFAGNDRICGGNGGDFINGGDGNDRIFGLNGNDILFGGSGNDYLDGGNGNSDECIGGPDSDTNDNSCNSSFNSGVGFVTIIKDAQPDSAQDFAFTGTSSFTLDDDTSATQQNAYVVTRNNNTTFTVTEGVTSGWTLAGLTCSGGGNDTSTNLGTRTATIGVDEDEDIVCTFTNTLNIECGNGVQQTGEQCDDGNTVNTDSCTNSCLTAVCGDSFVRTGVEQCDDSNSTPGDGCSATCQIEICGNGTLDTGEQCDDGNVSDTDSCTSLCATNICGDGLVNTGVEQCDDENTSSGDGCSATCQIEVSSSSSSTSSVASSFSSVAPALTIDKTAGDTAIAGLDFNYQITTAATSSQSSVQMTDTLPESMQFQAILAPEGWSCTTPAVGETGTITCTKSAMASAETADFTITTRTSECPQVEVTNTANIQSFETSVQSNSATHNVICNTGSSSSAASSFESSTSSFTSSVFSSSSSETSSSTSSSSSVAPVACVPSGLLAYWQADEEAGTTAVDSTGNGHTGTLENGATRSAPGAPGVVPNVSAFVLDGTDDQVRVGNAGMSHDTSDFSVSFFAQTTTGDRAVLGHFDNPGSGYRGWGAYFYATNRVNFFAYGDMGVNDTSFASPALLSGGWHHVVGTFQRSGDSVTIRTYVDGVLIGTNTALVGNIGINTDMFLGKYTFQSNFAGQLDDVRVYGRTLSDTEVTLLNTNCDDEEDDEDDEHSSSSSSSFSSFVSSFSSSFGDEDDDEDEETSSSSSSTSSGPETFGVTSGNQGNGGAHRGARSNEIFASANFIAGNLGIGGNAPGAFGGGTQNKPTKAQRELMCSVYLKYLSSDDTGEALSNLMFEQLASIMGVSKIKVARWFQDPELCAGLSSRLPTKTLSGRSEVTVLLTPEGYPISKDPVYNAYMKAYYEGGNIDISAIRRSVKDPSLAMARTRDDGKVWVSPGDYRIAGTNVWYYPDLSIYFTYDPASKTTTLPAGYRGDRQLKVASTDQSL